MLTVLDIRTLQNLNSLYDSFSSEEVHDNQVEHQIAQDEICKGPFWRKILYINVLTYMLDSKEQSIAAD